MTDPGGGFGWRAGSTPYSRAGLAEQAAHAGQEPEPIGVLLLPGPLESFALRDQAEDLLTAPGVVAIEPARMSYGASLRLPWAVADGLAATQARRLRLPGVPRAIVLFQALQYPLARALIARHPDAELWYWQLPDDEDEASPRRRARLVDLHLAALLRAAVTVLAADAPAPEDGPAPGTARSLVPVGHGTDWALLRAVAEGLPELRLLLPGDRHEAECAHDADYQACRAAPNVVWLRAETVQAADVGVVPFERSDVNQTALPYGIVEFAKLGRRAIVPDLDGVRTWERAVTVADGPQEWIAALRASAGARPDPELREWALAQTAHELNRPLWERLESLGIASGRLGSERVTTPHRPRPRVRDGAR
jgi:hypothetical protein